MVYETTVGSIPFQMVQRFAPKKSDHRHQLVDQQHQCQFLDRTSETVVTKTAKHRCSKVPKLHHDDKCEIEGSWIQLD